MAAQLEKKISVLIVDDHPVTRAGVAGEAEDGEEARRLLDELRPNIILLDLVMPGFSATATPTSQA